MYHGTQGQHQYYGYEPQPVHSLPPPTQMYRDTRGQYHQQYNYAPRPTPPVLPPKPMLFSQRLLPSQPPLPPDPILPPKPVFLEPNPQPEDYPGNSPANYNRMREDQRPQDTSNPTVPEDDEVWRRMSREMKAKPDE